jgi:hypothetical protein
MVRTERLFKAALILKGLDGAAELAGAVVLLLIPAAAVHRLVADVVSRDLLGPPDGFLTRHLVAGTAEFGSGISSCRPMVAATATAAGQRCSPGVRRAHAGTSSFRFTGRSLPDPRANARRTGPNGCPICWGTRTVSAWGDGLSSSSGSTASSSSTWRA